jgi:transcriptional regulator with XRE-family HTH domain
MSDATDVLQQFAERVRQLRQQKGLSQEELAFRANLDRTYISDIERAKRNISVFNIRSIADSLGVTIADLFSPTGGDASASNPAGENLYLVKRSFTDSCGFTLSADCIDRAARTTASQIELLPLSLFTAIDLKTLSSITGALFAEQLAREVGGIVNPIEKGHPGVIPESGKKATEAQLRNYPQGVEIKCTVGNVSKGSELKPGIPRVKKLSGITWQAHHREVKAFLGLVIDFAGKSLDDRRYPMITAVFYGKNLVPGDWGEISGTTGRNTKVTGMRSSGKRKMADGWVLVSTDKSYQEKYKSVLGAKFN